MWFKVDDKLYSHPKWLAAPSSARGLWVTAGAWSADQLTDGFVPRHVLAMLGGKPRDAAALVAAGLWHEEPEGWRFHDWSAMQPTAAEVRANRSALSEKRAAAGRKGAAKRWQADGKAMASQQQTDDPDPTRPEGTPQPPAERGEPFADAEHRGQHANCRTCGTNPRGKPPIDPDWTKPLGISVYPSEEATKARMAELASLEVVPMPADLRRSS